MDFDALADQFEAATIGERVQIIENEGLTHIGSGSSREVFGIPGSEKVIKLSSGNIYQNRNEATVWESAPQDLKSSLLPVLSYGNDYRWLVMPKAEPAAPKPEHVRAIRDAIRPSEWNCKDKNPENIGWYQGKLVLMDYGSGCGPSGLGKPY